MTKLLLATTALVASASFASAGAHISMSGSAGAGVGVNGTSGGTGDNNGEMHLYSGVDLDISMSGTSDSGVEFGASLSIDNRSNWYDTGDFEFDGGSTGTSFGNVYITSGGLTITLDDGGIGGLYDGDEDHDMKIAYATGGISFAMTYDVDSDNACTGCEVSGVDYSVSYSAGALGFSLTGNDSDDLVIGVTYSAGAFSAGLSLDDNDGTQTSTISVGYSEGAFSIDASAADDSTWDVSVGYSEGGTSISASTDEASAWEVTGSVDLGGGLAAVAGVNADSDWYLGATMSF